MGAKFVALSTPSATINKYGVGCKTDADCTNKRQYGLSTNQTFYTAITVAADKAKACCLYHEVTKAPSGTTAEIKEATDSFKSTNESVGLTSTVGEYNKFCTTNYPRMITDYTTAGSTSYSSYDAKTGLLKFTQAKGAVEMKSYCDGGAQALALATVAAAAVSVSMV